MRQDLCSFLWPSMPSVRSHYFQAIYFLRQCLSFVRFLIRTCKKNRILCRPLSPIAVKIQLCSYYYLVTCQGEHNTVEQHEVTPLIFLNPPPEHRLAGKVNPPCPFCYCTFHYYATVQLLLIVICVSVNNLCQFLTFSGNIYPWRYSANFAEFGYVSNY